MSLQSPLGKALGHGSAKTGLDHWLAQQSTAIALVPLGLWFTVSLLLLPHGSHEFVVAWVAEPLNAILLILLVIALVYHSMVGLQVIVEDYVQGGLGYLTMITVQFVHILLVVAGIYSIIVISLGAGQ